MPTSNIVIIVANICRAVIKYIILFEKGRLYNGVRIVSAQSKYNTVRNIVQRRATHMKVAFLFLIFDPIPVLNTIFVSSSSGRDVF